ncbi:MAG: methylglyoxal synthase [Flavobacteriales bacterium]|nr:methylglyoxal synthase [Flavobacteriales bacterium]
MKIALIAHDGKKADMVAFMRDHMDVLKNKKIELVATGTTGKHVESAGLKVQRVKSDPLGGDAQIAAEVAEGRVQAVFFFRDPLDKHPHEPDIAMLMRVCDVYNIPLATNPATADLIFSSLEQ